QFAQRLTSGWPSSPQAVAITANANDSYPTLTYLSDGTACIAYHTDSPTTGLVFSIRTDAGWTNYLTTFDATALDIASTTRSNTLFALVMAASGLDLIRFNTDTGTILDSCCLGGTPPDWMGGHLESFTNGTIFAIWQCIDSIGGKTLFYSRLLPCGAADNDSDQLPDTWEIEYGGMTNLQSGAHDLDTDGLADTAEYVAGTAPNDPTSLFQLAPAETEESEEGFQIKWNGLAGRLYTLHAATNLTATPAWTILPDATDLPGVDGLMTHTDATAQTVSYYRIHVEMDD
ncbi:MAG: hypothetical protein PHG65_13570, partial [Kiritimatiellae bacterium]|nr:hypothetical protein [Kiritimatiellia bacterium]